MGVFTVWHGAQVVIASSGHVGCSRVAFERSLMTINMTTSSKSKSSLCNAASSNTNINAVRPSTKLAEKLTFHEAASHVKWLDLIIGDQFNTGLIVWSQ